MDEWVEGPVLGIETSGRLTGLALVSGGKLLAETAVDLGASTQELLPGMLQSLLAGQALELSNLTRIGVSLGPGSFTGLRVGLSWARALAMGADVPLVGVSSHAALAFVARSVRGQILLLTGLRRGLICLELGSWEGADQWRPVLAGASRPVAEWSRIVEHHLVDAAPLVCLGEAVEAAFEADDTLSNRAELWTDALSRQRRPAPVAFLAARPAQAEHRRGDLEEVKLLYLRDADAKKPPA
jgi:tRNA threonylcarbamoyl adenosine modification protein YeaZ